MGVQCSTGTHRSQCGARRRLKGQTDIPTKTPGVRNVYLADTRCVSDSYGALRRAPPKQPTCCS